MADVDLKLQTEFRKALKDVAKFQKGADQELKKVNKNITLLKQASAEFLGNLAAQAAVAGFAALTRGAQELFDTFVTEGVEAAKIQEDAINDLNIALASTGQFTQEVSQDFQEFASQLQQNSRIGDEVILQNAALLQSLGRLSIDGLKEATQAALDLSAALKIDLAAATLLVGKAASGEVSSFSRYGLIIKKGATEAETFANVLAKINNQFSGAAAAQIKTFGGATEQLSNTFGDLQEEIGFTITRSSGFISIINELNKFLLDLQTIVKDNRTQIREFILNFITGLQQLVPLVGALTRLVTDFVSVMVTLSRVFSLTQGEAKKVEKSFSFMGGTISDVLKEVENGESVFKNFGKSGKEVEKVTGPLASLKEALDGFSKGTLAIEEALTATFEKIKNAANDSADTQIDAQNRVLEAQAKSAEEIELARIEAQAKLISVDQAEIDNKLKQIATIQSIQEDGDRTALELKLEALNQLATLEQGNAQKLILIDRKRNKVRGLIQTESDKKFIKNRATFLSTATTLANNESQVLKGIGKSAAIVNIGIKTAEAATASFAFGAAIGGPFLGALFEGIAITAGLAQASKVANLQTGLTSVPTGFPNDTFQAGLTSGERVVNVPQNRDLTNFLARQQNGNNGSPDVVAGLEIIADRLNNLENTIIVQIGNREVIRAVRDGQKAGGSIAV